MRIPFLHFLIPCSSFPSELSLAVSSKFTFLLTDYFRKFSLSLNFVKNCLSKFLSKFFQPLSTACFQSHSPHFYVFVTVAPYFQVTKIFISYPLLLFSRSGLSKPCTFQRKVWSLLGSWEYPAC